MPLYVPRGDVGQRVAFDVSSLHLHFFFLTLVVVCLFSSLRILGEQLVTFVKKCSTTYFEKPHSFVRTF